MGKPCESGRPSFRDVQCGEFNDWIYPEDGKVHTWKAHYFHDDNPCMLYCINEMKQVAAMKPRVIDGTMCYRGIRDICIGGSCKSLPCDLHFESNAVEDACGVCHGDGTECEFSQGVETLPQLPKGLTKLISVPIGTRNIKVEEMSPTLARLIVRDKDTKDIYIRGKTLGMFNVPGSQAWLGMFKKNQEALNIPGPVTKPLSIWVQRLENVTVKWSMALPAEQQRKPEFTWDFLKWTPCSAKCGPGTQKSEPSCMEEKAGLVEDSFCGDLEMPPAKVRPCEITKCEPRWMVGDWKGCKQPGNSKKERTRVVYCIKTIGEGEGESQIVPDSECPNSKPHNKELCENRRKREDTEYGSDIIFEDGSTYNYGVTDFGFHKKYDDYLKHFAAVSVPQRKCETIPLHLVSSPHFKHYFQVLETPDYDGESESEEQIALVNNTISDAQAQSKVSPDFYKNTFSGHQTDVSHFQTNLPSNEDTKISGRIKKNLDRKLRNLESQKKQCSSKKMKHDPPPPKRFKFKQNSELSLNHRTPSLIKEAFNTPSNYLNVLNYAGKDKIFILKQNKKPVNEISKCNASRIRKRKLSCIKSHKSFNCNQRNLTEIVEELYSCDENIKKKFLRLLKSNKACEPKNRQHYQEDFNKKNCHYILNVLNQPLKYSSIGEMNKYKPFSKITKRNHIANPTDPPKLNNHKFNKFSLRKFNLNFGKPFSRKKKMKSRTLNTKSSKNNLCLNPFDPLRSNKFNFYHKRPFIKDKINNFKDFYLEKRLKRHHEKNYFDRKKKPIVSWCDINSKRLIFKNKNRYLEKKKRSSKKWKKLKAKDSISKSYKDVYANGGTERRNYLNNLFRDSHPKFYKQEQRSPSSKLKINTGRLVIDRDSAENQKVEINFQDDETEDKRYRFKQLPRPSPSHKKLLLTGQQVFDLYNNLQSRSGRGAFYKKKNVYDKSAENIEINVKIPEKSIFSRNETIAQVSKPPMLQTPTPLHIPLNFPTTVFSYTFSDEGQTPPSSKVSPTQPSVQTQVPPATLAYQILAQSQRPPQVVPVQQVPEGQQPSNTLLVQPPLQVQEQTTKSTIPIWLTPVNTNVIISVIAAAPTQATVTETTLPPTTPSPITTTASTSSTTISSTVTTTPATQSSVNRKIVPITFMNRITVAPIKPAISRTNAPANTITTITTTVVTSTTTAASTTSANTIAGGNTTTPASTTTTANSTSAQTNSTSTPPVSTTVAAENTTVTPKSTNETNTTATTSTPADRSAGTIKSSTPVIPRSYLHDPVSSNTSAANATDSSTNQTSSNTTAQPSSNTTAQPSSNTTAQPSSNTTAQPSSNTTTAQTSSNTTAQTSSNTTAQTSSNTTAPQAANTTATAKPSNKTTILPKDDGDCPDYEVEENIQDFFEKPEESKTTKSKNEKKKKAKERLKDENDWGSIFDIERPKDNIPLGFRYHKKRGSRFRKRRRNKRKKLKCINYNPPFI